MKSEIERYIQEPLLDLDEDPLDWWKSRQSQYPLMSQLLTYPQSSSVMAQLKVKVPRLIFTHCSAHRLALAASDAACATSWFKRFEGMANQAYTFFSHTCSTVHTPELVDMQSVMDHPKQNSRGLLTPVGFHLRMLLMPFIAASNQSRLFLSTKQVRALQLLLVSSHS